MLTPKEIKFLNLIYLKLKGKHMETFELWKFLQEFFRIKYDLAYELAYLYDNNFEEAKGNFKNVTDPVRESYEDYWDGLDLNIKIVMEYTKDKNPNNYEEQYGDVKHDGTDYRIYSDINELEEIAFGNIDWICEDVEEWAENYVYMTEYNRSEFADEQANSYFDDMGDDEIIDRASIKEDLDELEEQKNELQSLQGELENFETKQRESKNSKEWDEWEREIEEVKSKMEDIGSEERIDEKKQEMIDDARENLKSEYRDEIYNELENPVEYFVGNGFYSSVRQLVRSGPVEFDCDTAKSDYLNNSDYDSIINHAGYSYWEEVRFEGHTYILVWDE